ncbi:NAD(P)/FAD-dependent oxidoreductase [Aquisalimonas lutea]|uniref:NAD(P)/FAD-dependent oxidoreductase n=1 Tax=Aquisalimonas lutea TaxID=1327750 RepID=UPI0025B5B0A5|nr:NAD(P)/FAD-dependent oxidoreductase [Aquisalimonas lutea]MDN3516412.1 NAD(P)/FAD-dependent oxidoreductase [Aquisalimonas lutea]
MADQETPHRIVVVGGGAGGLELATRLGRRLGRKGRARITLVDAKLSHVWKPLFHELAAGTLYSYEDTVDYLAQAKRHSFRFQYGYMSGLDRANRRISLAPVFDETGDELAPERTLDYDTLVIAVGSVSNHFNTPGAAEHCMYLDSVSEAERFQRSMAKAYFRAQVQEQPLGEGQLSVAIIGAGATGVELAAELRSAARKAVHYGLDRIDPENDLKLTLVEAADRVLPALSPGLSQRTHQQLEELGVRVITGKKVVAVTGEGVELDGGEFIPADTRVWSAGIKAPEWLADLDGLETNRANQLQVTRSLQTTRDANVFALGDCAACPLPDGEGIVPPRAQAASQQAAFLTRAVERRLRGQEPGSYAYTDYGSLISLSEDHAVGRLMGNVVGTRMIEGNIARLAYASLYRKHLTVLHGLPRVMLTTLAQGLTRHMRPRLKLH